MYEEIACEIDIRTLTSHQVLGQIFDQILTRFWARFWTRFLTRFWTRFFGPEKTVYSSTGTEKGCTLTTIVFLGPTQKTGYSLSTDNIVKRYLFVNDYKLISCFHMVLMGL